MRRRQPNRPSAPNLHSRATGLVAWLILGGPLGVLASVADTTNEFAAPLNAPGLPDTGLSFVRVIGALALVIGLFLGGVWLVRNWQRLRVQGGSGPKLNVLETRSLGGRHALYVIGYENERYLLASSPAGVNLLSHLPTAPAGDTETKPPAPPTFAQALSQVLKGK